MLSWLAVARNHPEVVRDVAALAQRIGHAQQRDDVAGGYGLRAVWPGADRGGLLGVGLDFESEVPRPCVFADVGAGGWEQVDGRSAFELFGAWDEPSTDRDFSVALISLPPPSAQVSPGTSIRSAGVSGSVGARVRTAFGGGGFLTAGHVARRTGASVVVAGGGRIGTVRQCHDPAGSPPLTACADIAFVECDPGVVLPPPTHPSTLGSAMPRADVELRGAVCGTASTWIRGASPWWAGPDPASGDWAYVIVTKDGVTDKGDSGGLATDATTGEVIGHVVGGAPGVYSLVQEIDYQLGLPMTPPVVLHGLTGLSLA